MLALALMSRTMAGRGHQSVMDKRRHLRFVWSRMCHCSMTSHQSVIWSLNNNVRSTFHRMIFQNWTGLNFIRSLWQQCWPISRFLQYRKVCWSEGCRSFFFLLSKIAFTNVLLDEKECRLKIHRLHNWSTLVGIMHWSIETTNNNATMNGWMDGLPRLIDMISSRSVNEQLADWWTLGSRHRERRNGQHFSRQCIEDGFCRRIELWRSWTDVRMYVCILGDLEIQMHAHVLNERNLLDLRGLAQHCSVLCLKTTQTFVMITSPPRSIRLEAIIDNLFLCPWSMAQW